MRFPTGMQGKATRTVGRKDLDKVQGCHRVRMEKEAHPSGLMQHKEIQDKRLSFRDDPCGCRVKSGL